MINRMSIIRWKTKLAVLVFKVETAKKTIEGAVGEKRE